MFGYEGKKLSNQIILLDAQMTLILFSLRLSSSKHNTQRSPFLNKYRSMLSVYHNKQERSLTSSCSI